MEENCWYPEFLHLCDGLIETEDGNYIPVHKVLLSIISPFFNRLFSAPLEDGSNVSEIKGIKSFTLQQIVNYSINAKILITDVNIKDMTLAANYLEIKELINMCHNYILSNISTKMCAELYPVIRKFEHLEITKPCERFLEMHFEELLKLEREVMVHFDFEALLTLLQSDNLNVSDEKIIFTFIHFWLQINPESEIETVCQLIGCLRMNLQKFSNMVSGMGDNIFKDLLAHNKIILSPSQNQRPIAPSKIFIAFEPSGSKCTCRITYDGQMDFWREWFEIPFEPPAVISDSEGFTYILSLNRGWCIQFGQDKPRRLPDMGLFREDCGLAIVGGLLYVIGGVVSNGRKLTVVERFNPATRHWSWIQDTLLPCTGPVAVLGGKIYSVGIDCDAVSQKDEICVQSYNPSYNMWRRMPRMEGIEEWFSIVTFDEYVCVLARRASDVVLLKYNPDENKWHVSSEIPKDSFQCPKIFVLGDKIVLYEDSELVKEPVAFIQEKGREDWVKTEDPLLCRLRRVKFFEVNDRDTLENLRDRSSYKWKTLNLTV